MSSELTKEELIELGEQLSIPITLIKNILRSEYSELRGLTISFYDGLKEASVSIHEYVDQAEHPEAKSKLTTLDINYKQACIDGEPVYFDGNNNIIGEGKNER